MRSFRQAFAFEAIVTTLPLGSVGFERGPDAKGGRMIWVDAAVGDRLMAMLGPGESYSDVILRIVEIERASESSLADDH